MAVAKGDDVVCTFTNTRQRGSIELKKTWVGTAGQTTLQIGTSAGGAQTDSQQTGADGGAPLSTGANPVDTGTYYVSESGGLTNYDSSLACFNDNGAGGGTADNGIKDGGEASVSPDAERRRGGGQGRRRRLHLHQHPPAGLDRAEEDLGRDGGPDHAVDRHHGRRHPVASQQPVLTAQRRSHRRQRGRHRHLLRLRGGRAHQL